MSIWQSIKYYTGKIFKFLKYTLIIVVLIYGALYFLITSIYSSVQTVRGKVFAALYNEKALPDEKAVQRFFQEKKKNSRAFATYLYEHSGNVPSSEPARSQWMEQAMARYLFSRQDLEELAKLTAQNYANSLHRFSNYWALELEKEYGFKAAILSTGNTKQHLKYDTMIRTTQAEYRTYWMADFGGNLALEFTVGAIITEIGGSIGEALGGDTGRTFGWLGGAAITWMITSYHSKYQKEESIKRIQKQTNQWLVKLEGKMQKAIIGKLEKQYYRQISRWEQTILDRRVEQWMGTSYLRPAVLHYVWEK